MALLVDSTVLVQAERHDATLDLVRRAAPNDDLFVAAISVSELSQGALRADTLERRLRRESFLDYVIATLTVLTFDADVARVHARLYVTLARSGQMIGANDLLIAATALQHGYAVLTDNIREFQRVPGLVVRQPAW